VDIEDNTDLVILLFPVASTPWSMRFLHGAALGYTSVSGNQDLMPTMHLHREESRGTGFGDRGRDKYGGLG
jgi:hypothetical protein